MVFPFQPKLKLSPQSSTLPLGTVYTLTAAVTDLGDPENPQGGRRHTRLHTKQQQNVQAESLGGTMQRLCLASLLPILVLLWTIGTPTGFGAEPADQQNARQALKRLNIPYLLAELIERAAKGDTQVVELMLAAGMDPNSQNKAGDTALMWAADRGHIDTVKVLLDSGAT